MRLLLTQRRNLKRKFLDIENTIHLSELMEAILSARAALWKQHCKLHDLVVKFVSRSELCRPGDGDRRSVAIPAIARRRRLSWLDVEMASVGRD
jgi:hypothetical protein